MKPYYEHAGITIYHGDCREVLPLLVDPIALVLTDPPYGISYRHSGHVRGVTAAIGMTASANRRGSPAITGDDQPFDPKPWLNFPNVILWGADHFYSRLPDRGRWLAWNKLGLMEPWDTFCDVEFAWHSKDAPARIFSCAHGAEATTSMNLVCVGSPAWATKVYDLLPAGFALVRECPTDELLKIAETMRPRYLFFLNWSRKVGPEVTNNFTAINMHCTALPFGAGGAPIENLLLRGHTETVITAHRMTDVIDGGPIYKTSGPVSLAGTKAQILDRFVQPCADLIRWICDTEPEPYPQVGGVVRFHRLPRAEYETFWEERR